MTCASLCLQPPQCPVDLCSYVRRFVESPYSDIKEALGLDVIGKEDELPVGWDSISA